MPMQRMPVPIGGYKPPASMGRASGRAASDHDVDDAAPKRARPASAPSKSGPPTYGASKKTSSATGPTKKTGTTAGKSNALGHGGRAAQLKERGVPPAVIGMIAREKGAAPGGKNYHGSKAAGKGGKK